MAQLRRCKCGCGETFVLSGRRQYLNDAHRQRDYRSRRQAKMWAWGYIVDEAEGDLSQFAEVYQRYLQWYRAWRHQVATVDEEDMALYVAYGMG